MPPVSVFSSSACQTPATDSFHPESPIRIARLVDALESTTGPWKVFDAAPTTLPVEEWEPHPPKYWQALQKAIAAGDPFFHERDVRLGPETMPALAGTMGAVEAALSATLTETPRAAFAAVRPAGHHASAERAMGFCILNVAAAAAALARRFHGLQRIAILDWDAHHGNGTDAITADDPSTLFISLHQHPYFPFTGAAAGSIATAQSGTNLSIPLAAGTTWETYSRAFEETVCPALRAFAPELVIVSCGFDAHRLDPMSQLKLENGDYGTMTRLISAATDAPLLSILEGGYYIPSVIESAMAHLTALSER